MGKKKNKKAPALSALVVPPPLPDLPPPPPPALPPPAQDDAEYESLMSRMMAGMQASVEEEEAAESEQAPLTVESVCTTEIPKLWPVDETKVLASGVKSDGVVVRVTPKFLIESLRVVAMFVGGSSPPEEGSSARLPSSRRKVVWALDKLMDTETAINLVADTPPGGNPQKEAIVKLAKSIHSEITTPVARRLIDEEIQDMRQRLRLHMKFKAEGRQQSSEEHAHAACEIIRRVSNIAVKFGSDKQVEALKMMVMDSSAFITAIRTLPPSGAAPPPLPPMEGPPVAPAPYGKSMFPPRR
jgi:hypothetical protein